MQILYTSLIVLALLIFSVYNIVFISKKAGVPKHLSESYYIFHSKQFFSGLITSMILLIAPTWIHINLKYSANFIYIILFVAICLAALVIIKDYSSSKIRTFLHHFFAWTGGLATIAWIHLTCPDFLRNVPRILLVVFLLIGLFTKSIKYSYRYFLELITFYAIIIVLLIRSLGF